MIPALLGLPRWAYALGAVVAVSVALWGWGELRERQGVVKERERAERADQETADGVDDAVSNTLRDVDPDDPDGVLRETGGLRDD